MHFCSCLHFVLSATHLRSDCTSIQFSDYWGKFFTQRVKVGELWRKTHHTRLVENQSRTEQEMKTEEPKDVQNNEKSRSRESEIREGRI